MSLDLTIGDAVLVDSRALMVRVDKWDEYFWLFNYDDDVRYVLGLVADVGEVCIERIDYARFDLVLCDGTAAAVFIDSRVLHDDLDLETMIVLSLKG